MSRTFKILVGYFIFILASILLGGCAIINKAKEQHQEKVANRFFNEHPDKDAQRCHEHFPLKDSTGDIHLDSTHKAHNVDYTGAIDSLKKLSDSLLKDSINRHWLMILDSIDTELGDRYRNDLLKQQQNNASLRETIQKLRDAYRPCKPDTAYYGIDHWYIDPALQTMYNASQQKLNESNKQLAAAKATNRIRFWMLIAAGAIIILLIVLLFNTIRLKNKLTIPHL